MNEFLALLANQAAALVAASTGVMALGALVIFAHRSPAHRQRIGELTIAAAVSLVALAMLPLPRTSLGTWLTALVSWETPGAEQKPHLSQALLEAQRLEAQARMPLVADPSPFKAPGAADPFKNQILPVVPAWNLEAALHDAATAGTTSSPSNDTADAISQDATIGGSESASDSIPSNSLATVPPMTPAPANTLAPPVARETAEAQSAAATPVMSWPETLAWTWLAGSIACLAWLAAGKFQLWRMTRRARPAAAALTTEIHSHLAGWASRRTRVLVAEHCARPLTFGWWRPTIVLPAALVRKASGKALLHVARHECAHVNRCDALGQALCNFALLLFWFQPLYWMLRHRIRLDAELVADDWAASLSSPTEYVEQLVHLVRRGRGAQLSAAGVMGLFSSQSQFSRRMEMLMLRSTRLATRCSRAWKLAVMLMFCGITLVAADAVGGRQAAAQGGDAAQRDQLLTRLRRLENTMNNLKKQATMAQHEALEQAERARAAEDKAAKLVDHYEKALKDLTDATKDGDLHAKMQEMRDMAQQSRASMEEMTKRLSVVDQENHQLRTALLEAHKELQRRGGHPNPNDPILEAKRAADPAAAHGTDHATSHGDTFGDNHSADHGAGDANHDAVHKADHAANHVDDHPAGHAAVDPFAGNGPAAGANNNNPFARAPSAAGTGTLGNLDLVHLATALADSKGNMRKAEIRLQVIQKQPSNGIISEQERALAEVDFETELQKYELLQTMAQAALRGAEAAHTQANEDLKRAEQLAERGFISAGELANARTQVQEAEARMMVISAALSN